MPGVLGQFSNGPIQFGSGGQIEQRGTIDSPGPSVTQSDPIPAASPSGGGVIASRPDTPDPARAAPGNGAVNGLPMAGGGFTNVGGTTPLPWDTNVSGGADAMAKAGDKWIGAGGALPTMLGFDDGGAVDPQNESDGTGAQGNAPLDPMSFVKQAAAFGRKQMGLPQNFSAGPGSGGDQEMGFDDGGVVPDQQPQGGVTGGGNGDPNAVDPRKAIAYLAGDGAVSPEIANALEQHVDPQGQMDPADRTMAALQKAPSPEAKFGMLQHYRTQYNGFSAGARAAMDKGNPGQAAMLATQAFDHTPTGYKVHFAPAQGGIAVSARKLGADRYQQPSMDKARGLGLPSKMVEPQDEQGRDMQYDMQQDAQSPMEQQGFAGGGPVDEAGNLAQRSAPDSRGVMDDYDEADYTQGGRGNGNMPDTAARIVRAAPEGAMERVVDGVNSSEPSTNIEDRRGESGLRSAVRNVTGYADGGVVDEDDGDNGVIPQAAPEADEGPQEEPAEAPQPQDDQNSTQVLSAQQFHALMKAGYDKPIDDGWDGLLQSVAGAEGPTSSNRLGPVTNPNGTPYDFKNAPVVGGQSDQGASPALQKQMNTPTPLSQVAAAQTAEQDKAKPDEREQKFAAQKARIEKLAAQLYPWASQSDQRNAYIAHALDQYMGSEQKIDQQGAQNKGAIAATREVNRLTIAREAEIGKNNRATDAHDTRMSIAQLQAATRQWTTSQQEVGRQFGRMLANNPSLANDPQKAWTQAQALAKQNGIDPQALMQVGQHLSGNKAPSGQQGQGGGQGQPTVVVFPKGPYAGKPMMRLPDGTYRLAPGAQ